MVHGQYNARLYHGMPAKHAVCAVSVYGEPIDRGEAVWWRGAEPVDSEVIMAKYTWQRYGNVHFH
jgi:hypothetical protein